jgi:hypothetical protein
MATQSTVDTNTSLSRLNGNWEEVFSELTKGDNLRESALLDRMIAANSQAAYAEYLKEHGNIDAPTSVLPTLLNSGVAGHVYWWGFNIEISHSALTTFINSADPTHIPHPNCHKFIST